MKRSHLFLLLLLAGGPWLGPNALQAQASYTKLVWADEFNYTGLPDPAKWTHDTARGCPDRCGWGNNELEYYTPRKENAWVDNGLLTITGKRENLSGAAYTSARLHSKGKFEFTYGKVEARAKLPAGIGTWPAIWMLGNNINEAGWPACGEIDIMEHRGYEMNKVFGTFHYPGHSGDKADGQTVMSKNVDSDFHIYSAEWTPAEIRLYTDGVLIHTLKNTRDVPFHHPFFLILNLAIGGHFAGPVDPEFETAQFQIDYVRVYQ
jgi:beta-glucanase (GH16 family)